MKQIEIVLTWLLCLLVVTQMTGCGGTKTDRENYAPLTEHELNLIDKYVSKATVEEDIGQLLMVGIPADLNTAEDIDSKALDELIAGLGVGTVIVNGYNYYDSNKSADDKEYLTRVINFNNLLQRKTRKSSSKLPLLIASDFENPSFPSVKRGLVLPPSALSLSTTQDGQLIRAVGRYIGTELTSVGIHIILGPVLDTNNVKQGNKNILQDRCFAGTSEGVARTASHYIAGLSESGVIIFAKHYPGHGSIESDPHQEVIPVYEGSKAQLLEELKPFIQSKNNIHGVMTSHIQLASSKEGGMATFSPEIVGELKKQGLDKKVIITDDLSEMGAIRKHMADSHKSYQDIAVDSFIAGHDLLLFAHVSAEKKSKVGAGSAVKSASFTLKDLSLVRHRLVDYINSSELAKSRFKESLRKVIILKCQVARMKSADPLERFLGKKEGIDTAFNFQTMSDGRTVTENTEKAMEKADLPPSINRVAENGIGNALVKESIRKSVIWINSKGVSDINLLNHSSGTRVIFAVYEDQLPKYRQAFSPHFSNAVFFGIPFKKDTSEFEKLEKEISSNFGRADILIYTVRDGSDVDLLKRLRKMNRKHYSEKVIVFCHNSPAIFDNDTLSDSIVIGNFTMHPFGFDVDIELLSGSAFQPKDLNNIPINIGDNGKFFNVSSTKWVESANPAIFGELFPQQSTLSCRSSLEKQNFLIPKPSNYESLTRLIGAILVFVLIAIFSVLIHLWPKHHLKHGEKPGSVVKGLADPLIGRLTAAFVFLVLIAVLYKVSTFFGLLNDAKEASETVKNVLTNLKN